MFPIQLSNNLLSNIIAIIFAMNHNSNNSNNSSKVIRMIECILTILFIYCSKNTLKNSNLHLQHLKTKSINNNKFYHLHNNNNKHLKICLFMNRYLYHKDRLINLCHSTKNQQQFQWKSRKNKIIIKLL